MSKAIFCLSGSNRTWHTFFIRTHCSHEVGKLIVNNSRGALLSMPSFLADSNSLSTKRWMVY